MTDKKVRILVGTRKGGYIVEGDRTRKKWKLASKFQPGTEVYHMVADPRHPGDLYACVNSWLWGPVLYQSHDYGKKWSEIATPMMASTKTRPPRFDGNPDTPAPVYPVVNLWHLEPGHASEPNTLFLGLDPYSLHRSDDLGKSWTPVSGLNDHPSKSKWNPGNGGPCLHTIIIDPTRPSRIYAGISAAGLFRSDDAGKSWALANQGVETPFQPEKFPAVGQCVHKVALDPARPDTVYRQDHGGIYVSHNAGESWERIGKSLDDDFGFVVATARSLPGRAFFVPLLSEPRVTSRGGFQVYQWTESTKKWKTLMPPTRFPGDYGTHREALACDTLDPAGIYAGTTTGRLFVSPDAGKSWDQVPFEFPAIHSVSVVSAP
jgi:BNR-Asp box repeat